MTIEVKLMGRIVSYDPDLFNEKLVLKALLENMARKNTRNPSQAGADLLELIQETGRSREDVTHTLSRLKQKNYVFLAGSTYFLLDAGYEYAKRLS